MQSKTTFLVCYDYGHGGLWAYIKARTKEEITGRYPELTILEVSPKSLAEADLVEISSSMTFDIDDEPSGWIASLVKERGKPSGA